ncbi:MAG: hypothetical protein IPN79_10730 [Saprospiraceae bacterium]|nr:hypothetical protein [Saprospiraceae bacterium]
MVLQNSVKTTSTELFLPFPAGWVISEESFIPTNKNINFLKLRASWGLNGNDRIGDFLFIPTVTTGSNYTFWCGQQSDHRCHTTDSGQP